MPSNFQHITIEDDGRVLAEAGVRAEPDVVRAALRVEAGHLPPGTRSTQSSLFPTPNLTHDSW